MPNKKRKEHKRFTDLLQYSNAVNHDGLHMPIMLTGPAGTAKSQAAEHLAETLGLNYGYMAGSQQLTKSDMLGYRSPDGKIIDSLLGQFYQQGGVFVIEEIDAINNNILLNLNTAIAGHRGYFAGRMVERHPDFRLIATANTYGGSDDNYNARTKLDASTMSRFLRLEWELDEQLETDLLDNLRIDEAIKRTREELRKRGYELTMRDALSYKALLEVWIGYESAAASTILREVDPSQRPELLSYVKVVLPKSEPIELSEYIPPEEAPEEAPEEVEPLF